MTHVNQLDQDYVCDLHSMKELLKWLLTNKATANFKPLFMGENDQNTLGKYGEWEWVKNGYAVNLTTLIRGSLVTIATPGEDPIVEFVWNHVLEEINDPKVKVGFDLEFCREILGIELPEPAPTLLKRIRKTFG